MTFSVRSLVMAAIALYSIQRIQGFAGLQVRTFARATRAHSKTVKAATSTPPSASSSAGSSSAKPSPKPKINPEDFTGSAVERDRPYTLPPGAFRPKQSLGQNFLSDQNYVLKIVDSFADNSENGHRVIEIGPGPGALTRVLQPRYPNMTAIEIDQRAVAFLGTKLPNLNIVHQDVLTADWPGLAAERGGRLNIIANLPYYIVSQVLFTLADSHKAINKAVVTMQWEVAERVCAKPRTKAYGIPSVVFQLYAKPQLNFKIPPSVFFPKPKVDSALVTLDFSKPNPALYRVRAENLRAVLLNSFRQRRKMMRQSLKELLQQEGLTLPEKWGTMRPEELKPAEFVELTIDLFGEISEEEAQLCGHYPARDTVAGIGGEVMPPTREELAATKVWRQMKELQ